ncbi:MAG: hypothetical protein ACK4YP_06870, partial [Myxococcota bacterium]
MRPDRAPAPQVQRASTVWAVARAAFSFALSVAIHLAIASPAILWLVFFAEPMIESPGDEGPEDAPLGNDGGEVALGEPEPMSVSLYVEPAPSAVPAEATPTGPAAPTSRSPIEGTAEGDPNTTTISPAERLGVRGRRPRGERKPCETIDEIVAVADDKWRVERDVVDYYAAHLRELQKQVAVSTHTGPDGKPDGVRVFLPRCSVLRQAGIKHGDII